MAVLVPMISAAFLLLFLLKMESATVAFASPASLNIYNIIDSETIQVRCEGYPEKALRFGEFCGWGFSTSQWGTTKWTCFFRWGSHIQYFVTWIDKSAKAGLPWEPCMHCVWLVQRDGFYLYNESGAKQTVFVYPWFIG